MFVKPLRTWGSTMNTLIFEASSLSDEAHVLAFQNTHTTMLTKFDVHELTLHHAHITFRTHNIVDETHELKLHNACTTTLMKHLNQQRGLHNAHTTMLRL
jgi:hypothetical protein